jgi:ubiquitin carboxyl-terminal hydrolase L5
MNAPEVQLGDSLLHFKESTMDLNTALRGHRISSNKFIRTIHNSFTRRMDHLNADLALQNEVSDAGSKKAKTKSTSKKGKKKGQSKVKASEEYGFHFVAYVPAGGLVWELDGLKTRPLRLGKNQKLSRCENKKLT